MKTRPVFDSAPPTADVTRGLREIARRDDVVMTSIGEVRGQRLEIDDLLGLPVVEMRERWRTALERTLAGRARE